MAGELDLYRLPELTEALQSAAGARRILIDLREVTFLDSTTLALLVQEHRRRREEGREFVILTGPHTPMTTFALTGVDRILPIQSDGDGVECGHAG